ncbi:hypothetical protein [Thermus islandicus]|uniref:hypothetical protein n=1 Tax=Thermus islandicus TaxID=540988 RepID=UPI0003F6C4E8|nr:hypothetical protein [Thermus islandicus]
MRPVDALARYLWEQGLDVFTDPLEPPGHLVVRDGGYTRIFSPGEVAALAAVLWALGRMDAKGRPIEVLGEGQDPLPV